MGEGHLLARHSEVLPGVPSRRAQVDSGTAELLRQSLGAVGDANEAGQGYIQP